MAEGRFRRPTVGLFDPSSSCFHLKNTHAGGKADRVVCFGPLGRDWLPLAGDWNGDGQDTVGLFDPSSSCFHLKNTHAGGKADRVVCFGPLGRDWLPLVGDWNGDGQDTVGLFDPVSSRFYFKNTHTGGRADDSFGFGPRDADWLPIAGKFSVAGVDNTDADFSWDGSQLNFVFILTDDQRFDTLWAMPYVQRYLVKQGVLFENAIVTDPLCCPARASILAGGLYTKNTGVLSNQPPTGGFDRFEDKDTLATRLRHSGYRTALVGKYLNYYPLGYVPPGWSLFVGNKGPGVDNWNAFRVTVGSSEESPATGEIVPVAEYITDYQRDVVLDFIREPSNEPFFVLWSTYAPHGPATPAVEDEGKFNDYLYRERAWGELDVSDKPGWVRWKHRQELQRREEGSVDEEFPRRQLRSLQAVDRGVKAIIEMLAAVGKLDETVIVFTSDNGYMWGEHGLWSKTFPFEESIRVPLVVRFPNVNRRVEPHLVAVDIDIPATVIDIAHAAFRTDGKSLIPLLLKPNLSWPDGLLISSYLSNAEHVWAGIRTKEWKYVENAAGDEMLFDLPNDPFEETSKHDDPSYAKVKQDLKERLDAEKGLAMTTLGNLSAMVGEPFSWQLKAWGGIEPYSWSMVNLTPQVFLGPERKALTDTDIPVVLGPDYAQCGAPAFSKKETGLFIWKSCHSERWHIRATPGNQSTTFASSVQSTTFVGSVAADAPLREVTGFRLGNSDILEQSEASRIAFAMEIYPGNVNGFDFSLAANAMVEFDIDTRTLPRGLTLDSQSGLVSGVPLQPVQRTLRIRVTDSSERKIDGKPQDFIWDIKITIEPSEQ